jgi:hypothetical protein
MDIPFFTKWRRERMKRFEHAAIDGVSYTADDQTFHATLRKANDQKLLDTMIPYAQTVERKVAIIEK